jgi:hypothetical protein
MLRLKLKCIQEKTQQHNSDHIDKFNKALQKYCDSPVYLHEKKSDKPVEYYKWYHTNNLWPLDLNEDILIFENNCFSVYRSFSVLQNLIYKVEVAKTKVGVDFYWMRIKTPSGKSQYET